MVKRYHQRTKALYEKIYGMEELPPATHRQGHAHTTGFQTHYSKKDIINQSG